MTTNDEEYLRVLAAHFHALLIMQIAREKFGKSLFELSPEEDKEAQSRAYGMLKYCYALLGSEALAGLKVSGVPPDRIQ